MSQFSDIRFTHLQASIFLKSKIPVPSDLLANLISGTDRRFNGNNALIPQQPDMPPEVPVIVLNSADDSLTLNASNLRLDLVWRLTGSENTPPTFNDFQNFALKCFSIYENTVGQQPGRLALITRRHQVFENAHATLRNHFCTSKWQANSIPSEKTSKEFEIHFCDEVKLSDHFDRVNFWTRFKTPRILAEDGIKETLFIENDVNTLNENLRTATFDEFMITEFLSSAKSKIESELGDFYA